MHVSISDLTKVIIWNDKFAWVFLSWEAFGIEDEGEKGSQAWILFVLCVQVLDNFSDCLVYNQFFMHKSGVLTVTVTFQLHLKLISYCYSLSVDFKLSNTQPGPWILKPIWCCIAWALKWMGHFLNSTSLNTKI